MMESLIRSTSGACSDLVLSFTVLALVACAAPQPITPIPGPQEWVSRIDASQTGCQDLYGTFNNQGEKLDEESLVTNDGRLAQKVFSRSLPRGAEIRYVRVGSNIDAGWMGATLVGNSSLDISFAVSCLNGWHVLQETRSGENMSDGVQLVRYQQMSYFRLDRDGRLIARVVTDASYRKNFQEETSEATEVWYRFEPARDTINK